MRAYVHASINNNNNSSTESRKTKPASVVAESDLHENAQKRRKKIFRMISRPIAAARFMTLQVPRSLALLSIWWASVSLFLSPSSSPPSPYSSTLFCFHVRIPSTCVRPGVQSYNLNFLHLCCKTSFYLTTDCAAGATRQSEPLLYRLKSHGVPEKLRAWCHVIR